MIKNTYRKNRLVLVVIFFLSIRSVSSSTDKELRLYTKTDLSEINLQIYDGDDFKFLYPPNAVLEITGDKIVILGPGDIQNKNINSYTFYIKTYDNPGNLSAKQWATQKNIEQWQLAIEKGMPVGGIPVNDGKLMEEKTSIAKISGEKAFRIHYYAFDSHRIAFYIDKNQKLYELSYTGYPIENSYTAPYKIDVYSFILNSFLFK
ncbi:hypothetical protein QA601_04425 [Chitinispirillales bacterium ANBcel5]|uniref:hypothetical protein n=1 Tax=Cellulosispirillum alkaliphilum TaxID=3039283 RepID=UPI002A4EB01E|nr:hypothetical protein [Chitinispirillales bacterium ANBcel5]